MGMGDCTIPVFSKKFMQYSLLSNGNAYLFLDVFLYLIARFTEFGEFFCFFAIELGSIITNGDQLLEEGFSQLSLLSP
jgi:hypothetical protein